MDVRCVFCGALVDPEATTTFRKVIGWEHPRADGGTNAIALRQPVDEFACWSCIDRLRKGLDPLQASLEL